MGAIVVGLRPSDDARLRKLAQSKGIRPQDLASNYLDRAIRRANILPAERSTSTDPGPSAALEALKT